MRLKIVQAATVLPTKIMQIKNRKNTKSLSPTQFSQTQDVPLGKHRRQNTSCKESLAAERQKCKQLANSQKRSCYTLEIKRWGWGFNKGASQCCSLEVFLLQTPVIWPVAAVQGNLWGPFSPTELLMQISPTICTLRLKSVLTFFCPHFTWKWCFIISVSCKKPRGITFLNSKRTMQINLHTTYIWLLRFEYNESWQGYNLRQLAETAVMAQPVVEWKKTRSNNKKKAK